MIGRMLVAHLDFRQGRRHRKLSSFRRTGDNIHLIDAATNKVTAEIKGIEVNHGAAVAPDGKRFYFSNEAEHTLDVVDGKTFAVTKRIPLSGRPNNIAISRDGRRVYVSIVSAPGAVDVIDTGSLQKEKSIPTKGGIHNVYVTPDGKYIVAGSIVGRMLTVIDMPRNRCGRCRSTMAY
jgi:YVTN family beta-propeller protein